MSQSKPRVAEGAVIAGQYRLTAMVGRGGYGNVYRAQHDKLGKVVAIKFLHREFAEDASRLERFRREAQAAGNLQHPNICHVFDFGVTEDGVPFYIMDFIEGQTLGEVILQRKRLPASEAGGICGKLADALQVAHDAGLIHRDIKPGNIIVRPDGEPILVDFGLAKLTSEVAQEDLKLTATGAAVGTPEYMSPEQALGQPLDARSDIYSLGCVFYFLLAGVPPFHDATELEIMRQHARVNASPLPADVEIEAHVKSALFRALEKDPAKRQQSAAEFRRELTIAATKQSGPKRLPVLAIGAVALAASVILWVAAYQHWSNDTGRQKPARTATPELTRKLALQREANARTLMAEALACYANNNFARATSLARLAVNTLDQFPDVDPEVAATIYGKASIVLGNSQLWAESERSGFKQLAALSHVCKPHSPRMIEAKIALVHVLSKWANLSPAIQTEDFTVKAALYKSEKLLAQARKDLASMPGTSDLLASVIARQAALACAEARWAECAAMREQYLPMMERTIRDPNDLIQSYFVDGYSQGICGDVNLAVSDYSKAIDIQKKFWGPREPEVTTGYSQMAQMYMGIGELAQAKKYFDRARQMFARFPSNVPQRLNFDDIIPKFEMYSGTLSERTTGYFHYWARRRALNQDYEAYISQLPDEFLYDRQVIDSKDAWKIHPDAKLSEVVRSEDLHQRQLVFLCGSNFNDGEIARLGKLPQVRLLNLEGSRITDGIADVLPNFPGVTNLDLALTPVGDRTVIQAARLPLEILQLSATPITNKSGVTLAGCQNLKRLVIQETQVTDPFLRALSASRTIQSLDLRNTMCSDDGLRQLAGLTSLRKLQVGLNRINGSGLSALPQLNELVVEMPLVPRFDPSAIRKMTGLKTLMILSVPIPASEMEFLSGLNKMENLCLASTDFDDGCVKYLRGMDNLRILNLNHTRITDNGLAQIAQVCPNLQELHVSQNEVRDLRPIAQMKKLKVLTLEGLEIGGEALATIEVLPALEHLTINWTNIKPEQVVALGRACPKLHTIHALGIPLTAQNVVDILKSADRTVFYDEDLFTQRQKAQIRAGVGARFRGF